MPLKPYKYIISLSEAERQALESLVRRHKTERSLADRARIILWAADGATIEETQHRLGCSEQIVLNWRRAYLARREQEGPVGALRDRPRPGRPVAGGHSRHKDGSGDADDD